MIAERYIAPPSVRRSLLAQSRTDRRFFDQLVILIWCECKDTTTTKSSSWEEWADCMLLSYKYGFATPRQMLSKRKLDALQAFINSHTFTSLTDARRQISCDLLDDCCAAALGCLSARYGRREE